MMNAFFCGLFLDGAVHGLLILNHPVWGTVNLVLAIVNGYFALAAARAQAS